MTTSADNDKIPTAAAASKHDDNPVAPSPVDSEFADIAPYDDRQFHARLERLSREPGFEHAVRFIMPGVDFEDFRRNLLQVRDQHDFQTRIMGGFLMHLEKMTTSGVSADGAENICDGRSYTFMSNHRDIVLDASFLNLCLLRFGKPLTQVAIGNNLLIYEWISDLVKLNRSFIVKRNVRPLEALNAARQLSAYIHFTINQKNESVWIAQREGRTKDSNDMTQESLVKMLGIAGEGNMVDHIAEINLLPVSISYEYDPNDYLKVREYLLKRRNPEYKKCQHDDLLSMETGLTGFKGRVHFHFGRCIMICHGFRSTSELRIPRPPARPSRNRSAASLTAQYIPGTTSTLSITSLSTGLRAHHGLPVITPTKMSTGLRIMSLSSLQKSM